MRPFKNIFALLFFASFIMFTACSDSSNNDPGEENIKTGNIEIKITDSPIDDKNIQGVYVTFSAIKVDGKQISMGGKKTVNIYALQNGNSVSLLNNEIAVGNLSDVELVLDYDIDAQGNSPGTYILTADNTKHNLKSVTENTLQFNIANINNTITENELTTVYVDFDLRKAIKYEENATAEDKYNFVDNLNNALRAVDGASNYKISGNYDDTENVSGEKVIVYAYKKGSFDLDTEKTSENTSGPIFPNALTSTEIKEDGTFEIHFLNQGEYELHFISFDSNNGESFNAKGMITTTASEGADLQDLNIDADKNLEVVATAIVNF